jgi:putative transposase
VAVHAASVQDRDGARLVLEPLRRRFMRLRLIVADSIYNGGIAESVRALRPRDKLRLEIKPKRPEAEGFEPVPFRWRVERTVKLRRTCFSSRSVQIGLTASHKLNWTCSEASPD